MIGFKKIPKKLIFIVFTICVILIFLIYIDDSSHKPLPSEIIKETESTKYEIDIIKSLKGKVWCVKRGPDPLWFRQYQDLGIEPTDVHLSLIHI